MFVEHSAGAPVGVRLDRWHAAVDPRPYGVPWVMVDSGFQTSGGESATHRIFIADVPMTDWTRAMVLALVDYRPDPYETRFEALQAAHASEGPPTNATSTPTPSETVTETPTGTPTVVATESPSEAPTEIPAATPTATSTPTESLTETATTLPIPLPTTSSPSPGDPTAAVSPTPAPTDTPGDAPARWTLCLPFLLR